MSLRQVASIVVVVASATALQQVPSHTALVRHPPGKILTWALDGLRQMGYTIQKVDTTAGTIVAERLGRLDPDVGSRFDELDIAVTAKLGDTSEVRITTASWTHFLQAARRHRDAAPSARAEEDATRLLAVLK